MGLKSKTYCRNKHREVAAVASTYAEDTGAIEELHRKDVEATKAGDIELLKSLMDSECILLPPDSEPESGQSYMDNVGDLSKDPESQPQIIQLVQDWEELKLFGEYAYECGIIRYTVKGSDGKIINETQRLMRILRRQENGAWRVFRAMWHKPRTAN